jgi:hypothetical protein
MQDTKNILASQQNQDVQGDTSTRLSASLYEYMLGHMQFAPVGDTSQARCAPRFESMLSESLGE